MGLIGTHIKAFKVMYYAQFYQYNLNGELAEACGSDSVFILDGRKSILSMHKAANDRAIALNKSLNKGFAGYMIRRGETFTRSTGLSSIHPVIEKTPYRKGF